MYSSVVSCCCGVVVWPWIDTMMWLVQEVLRLVCIPKTLPGAIILVLIAYTTVGGAVCWAMADRLIA